MSAKTRSALFRAKLSQHLLNQSQGFTLIELLVVVVIVGILTAVAVPTFLNQVRRSRVAEAQAALSLISRASEVYRLDQGIYPGDYADISPAAIGSTRYLEDEYTTKAPHYDDPTIAGGGATDTGVAWQSVAVVATYPAYKNFAGVALTCTVGLGDQVALTDLDKSCNL